MKAAAVTLLVEVINSNAVKPVFLTDKLWFDVMVKADRSSLAEAVS